MANQYGIDLGNVYARGEAIKGAKQDREFGREKREWDRADRTAARERANALADARSKAATGDSQAMKNLAVIDPKVAQELQSVFSKMSEDEREQFEQQLEDTGNMVAGIMNATDPEAMYQQGKRFFPEDMQASLPERYDPNFMAMLLARGRKVEDQLKNPEVIGFGDKEQKYKDGRLLEEADSSKVADRKNALTAAKIRSGGSGGLKSADEGLMFRQAGALLGGIFNEQGELQNLDALTRSKVQSIATEATRIYTQGGVTRSQAVAEAGRRMGYTVQDPSLNSGKVDRNKLLNQYATPK